ncbi:MAG: phospho-N-acetylmuramoyl-pentapeptide-transferase [Chloroflexi bacterium]|nr:phospho-N-acetylmuramoyl-pentapeptide-transferase [Chloroflexota bacterium]MBU1751620.1 phospho-N-acetylmuramoyl-pentapeptide-transferase [Chloroflexota bacterium]
MAYSLVVGTVTFLIAVVMGAPLIRWLKRHRIGKQIRIDGPSSHQTKTGTPTMGGLMILAPVIVITIVLNVLNLIGIVYESLPIPEGELATFLASLMGPSTKFIGLSILFPLGVLVAYGTLGGFDDYVGVRGLREERGTGVLARYKLLWQILFAVGVAVGLHVLLDLRSLAIPTIPDKIEIGLLYIPLAAFIIVAFSNAVNLSDGLDGLAGGTSAIAFVAYGVIALLQGQIYLVLFCFTMTGALLAFLWYNAYPAQLFMGDVGSLAVGATLAVVGLMTGQWLLLPIVGAVFVVEALSDVLQVGYFKLTKGKRIFKMAPLHHHFELLGWSEVQVVQRFWLVAILAAMLGVALALV